MSSGSINLPPKKVNQAVQEYLSARYKVGCAPTVKSVHSKGGADAGFVIDVDFPDEESEDPSEDPDDQDT